MIIFLSFFKLPLKLNELPFAAWGPVVTLLAQTICRAVIHTNAAIDAGERIVRPDGGLLIHRNAL